MRAIVLISYLLLIYSRADSQKLVKTIDSLINSIEASKALTMISRCDTNIGSHTDYAYIVCEEFYSYNNSLFKIIRKSDRIRFENFWDTAYGLKPKELGTISMNAFYFDKESLIKVFSTNYSDDSGEIHYFYFTQEEIIRLKWLWEQYKDRYYQTKDWFEEAEKLLSDFKQGKIN